MLNTELPSCKGRKVNPIIFPLRLKGIYTGLVVQTKSFTRGPSDESVTMTEEVVTKTDEMGDFGVKRR